MASLARPHAKLAWQTLWNERKTISRGSYIASAFWFFALLFTAFHSGAFSSHFGSILLFLLAPIMALFLADRFLGKRNSPT